MTARRSRAGILDTLWILGVGVVADLIGFAGGTCDSTRLIDANTVDANLIGCTLYASAWFDALAIVGTTELTCVAGFALTGIGVALAVFAKVCLG